MHGAKQAFRSARIHAAYMPDKSSHNWQSCCAAPQRHAVADNVIGPLCANVSFQRARNNCGRPRLVTSQRRFNKLRRYLPERPSFLAETASQQRALYRARRMLGRQ